MVLRFLGEATTDENGLAVLSDGYTGTGAGEIDVVAKTEIDDRIIQSETCSLWDCIVFDNGTSNNHNDIWGVTGMTLTRGSDYSTLVETSTNGYCRKTNIARTSTIRVDVNKVDGYNTQGFFILYNGANEWYANAINTLGVDINEWATYEITVDNTGKVLVKCLTTNQSYEKSFSSFNASNPIIFEFRGHSETTTLYFKNFKIYGESNP